MSSVIDKVTSVAKLELTEKEKKKFDKDLKNILKAFSSLDKVDVSKVNPSFQPIEMKNVLREDEIEASLSQKEALSNTKHKEKGFFKGPRVI